MSKRVHVARFSVEVDDRMLDRLTILLRQQTDIVESYPPLGDVVSLGEAICAEVSGMAAAIRTTARLVESEGAVILHGRRFHRLRTDLARRFALAISTLIGTPTAGSGNPRQTVWDVRPRALERPQPSNVSAGNAAAELHTDSAYVERPERYFGLWCLRADRYGGGVTLLRDGGRLISQLDSEAPKAAEILAMEPLPFLVEPNVVAWHRIYEGTGSELMLRYRPSLVNAGFNYCANADLKLRTAHNSLTVLANRASELFCLLISAGDVLFVNNHRMLHGRSAFVDPARHLLRIRMHKRTPR